jgi:hypothetical protein
VTRPTSVNASSLVCVAVSVDEDATGLYYRYAFDMGKYVRRTKRK